MRVTGLQLEHVEKGADIMAEAFSFDDETSMSRALGLPREGFPLWMRHAEKSKHVFFAFFFFLKIT